VLEKSKVISIDSHNGKVVYLLPITDVDSGALDQITDVCSYDFVTKMSIMPDVHQGYFLPIGGVALVEGKISPPMVGYDIGCGMIFLDTGVKTKYLLPDKRERVKIMNYILSDIPVGFNMLPRENVYDKFISASGDKNLTTRVTERAGYQLGTLGGGNHFIELGENQAGNVCITIHSGSRNPGHSIAGFYIEHGDFLNESNSLGRAYIHDMSWALDYALANRQMMMYKVLVALGFNSKIIRKLAKNIVNENHNTATKIKDGWLHRKGATPAEKDQLGIIPGNMGDGVALTMGLGNSKYLDSASHGCGRHHSRNHSKKTLSMDIFKKKMAGIVSNGIKESNLDESPDAYKDFEKVLAYQDGVVVKVVDRIRPLINIKG
jgi:tRNA-splicing ligase RtcB